MGIHNLNKIIKKYAPNCIKKLNIKDNFKGKKVAIDISLYIFKYKAIFGDYWINSIIKLFNIFHNYNIKTIVVFDNKNKLQDKKNENTKRKDNRLKLLDKIKNLEQSISLYKNTGEITETLKQINSKSNSEKVKRLLTTNESKESEHINIKNCEYELESLKSQIVNITNQDTENIKKLCDCLGIDYIISESEAEATCVYLNKHGIVDCVLSDDTDIIAYGCIVSVNKINTVEEDFYTINFQELLLELDLSRDSFVDLCILLGCDFNTNVKGIGPEKSYKLIKEYKSIEEIEKNKKIDISCLNHTRLRELFSSDIKAEAEEEEEEDKEDDKEEKENQFFNKKFDRNLFEQFLFQKNIRLNLSW